MWTSGISRVLLKAQSLSAPRTCNVSLPSATDQSTNGRLLRPTWLQLRPPHRISNNTSSRPSRPVSLAELFDHRYHENLQYQNPRRAAGFVKIPAEPDRNRDHASLHLTAPLFFIPMVFLKRQRLDRKACSAPQRRLQARPQPCVNLLSHRGTGLYLRLAAVI
jgi:hypothetical protein